MKIRERLSGRIASAQTPKVITHLLGRLGYLKSGKCKIMVVDTFHLFEETMPFLADIEKEYGFKAEVPLLTDASSRRKGSVFRVSPARG